MRKFGFLLASFLVSFSSTQAQDDNSVIFTKSIGFNRSNEFVHALTEHSDGTIVLAGRTDKTGSNSVFVLKVNPINGDTTKTFSFGAVNANDISFDIIPSNNGFLITGETTAYNQNKSEEDAFIVELDDQLNWKYYPKNFGSENIESGKKLFEHNGYFYVGINQTVQDPLTGQKNYYSYIIKVDSQGKQIWSQDFSSLGQSWFGDCLSDKDGNLIILLTTKDNLSGGRQIHYLKMSETGELLDQKRINTSYSNGSVSVSAITLLNDSTIVLTGGYYISWTEQYPLYLQITTDGDLLVEKIFDFGKKAFGRTIIAMPNNKCLVCGEKGSDGFCLIVNESGDHEAVYYYDYMINDALIHSNGDLYTVGDGLINYPSNTFRNIYLSRTKLK